MKIMSTVLLIIVALISLSLLVVIHEFGHFIAAKLVSVWPEEFGIGLPPRVWGKKIGETLWSINALPLGGFVRLHGEMGDGKMGQPERAFVNASKLKRGIIAVAGVTMNFVYAILAFSLIFFVLGIPQGVKVTSVFENSPASEIGLKENDTILAINGKSVYNPQFFGGDVVKNAGHEMKVTFSEGGTDNVVSKTLTLRKEAPEGQGLLGIVYEAVPASYMNVKGASKFLFSLYYGAQQTYDFSALILSEFGKMFGQLFTGHVPAGLAGPLGVVGVTAEVAKQGIWQLISFSAIISINLALVNLIPFPPLDGSRVLFLFIEGIVGKKRLPRFEEKVHTVGMYILLGLMLLLTIREVPKLLTSGSLSGFVDKLIK